jgi:hypothetical protein
MKRKRDKEEEKRAEAKANSLRRRELNWKRKER